MFKYCEVKLSFLWFAAEVYVLQVLSFKIRKRKIEEKEKERKKKDLFKRCLYFLFG